MEGNLTTQLNKKTTIRGNPAKMDEKKLVIDAHDIYYKELNEMVRDAILNKDYKVVELDNVNGQRYIGDAIEKEATIIINGVPGNDLGAFMSGPTIIVNDNVQDAVGNTMSLGKIVVHGQASDVIGYGMRGGKIFIKGDVGYRVGIHMKAYKERMSYIVAGGNAGDFFGEYMAGGIMVLLGLDEDDERPIVGDYLGTGMHGGIIYVRGEVNKKKLGKEVGIVDMTDADMKELEKLLKEYAADLDLDYENIMSKPFNKIIPVSHRPYGRLYAY